MKREWVRTIRDRCIRHDVAFFFKQWGGVQKSKTGRVLDGRTWEEMPVEYGELSVKEPKQLEKAV
jgi:protein gp37